MFHFDVHLRLVILIYVILLSCDDGFSKPSSFLKKIQSLHHSDESRTRFRRNLDFTENLDEGSSSNNSFLDRLYEENRIYEQFYHGPVCELIEARHDPEQLKALENCTMVDGIVHISFFNDGDTDRKKIDLGRLSFPKLRVITENLLIYRVYGLKTLRHLFPNLVMIGGKTLFSRYALTIFENPDLIEVGLDSLKYIKRGGVRIENNGDLCYLGTIDWALLGKVPGQDKNNEMVAKPKLYNNNLDSCIDQCSNECKLRNENGIYVSRCWGLNPDRCQKGPCPASCQSGACFEGQHCTCHPQCLGGCFLPNNASTCYACKNAFLNNTCVDKCPEGTLKAESGYHCVTTERCRLTGSRFHKGICMARCPNGYKHKQLEDNTFICVECNGTCFYDCTPKQGEGKYVIDSERKLYYFDKCTVFRQKLVIDLSVGDVMETMEKTLGELEEIGSLVVTRSAYLTSLSFFASLKRITGEKEFLMNSDDEAEGYSVYILNNNRLKDLWNMGSNVNFTIGGGKAFFHFNPYLCMDKIKMVTNLTKEIEDSTDVSHTTNGDRVTCNMGKIESVNVTGYAAPGFISQRDNSVTVKISWKIPQIQDHRTLIGYNIYRRQTKEDEKLTEEDLSEESRWKITYLSKDDLRMNNEVENEYTSTLLNTLMPYTNYSFYIATYTIAQAAKGAKSDIITYETRPSKPSHPQSVTLHALNSSALLAEWEHPRYMNGKIGHYIVKYYTKNKDAKLIGDNVCKNQAVLHLKPAYATDDEEIVSSPTNSNGECSCNNKDRNEIERDVTDSVQFEDFLINELIAENFYQGMELDEEEPNLDVQSRKKRSLRSFAKRFIRSANTTTPIPSTINATSAPFLNQTDEEMYEDDLPSWFIFPKLEVYDTQNITVNGSTKVVIPNLVHFTEYVVSVQACNHAYKEVNCSKPQIASRRTKMLVGANDITSTVTVERMEMADFSNQFLVKFDPPESPNSLIYLYTIKLQSENSAQNVCCAKEMFEKRNGCVIAGDRFDPATYSGEVIAVSLAGSGAPSKKFSIVIEKSAANNHVLQGVLSSLSAVLVLVIIVGCIVAKKRLNSKQPPIYASVNPEYSSVCMYELDEYEMDEDDIKLIREIGQGHFGKVYEGIAKKVIYGQSETRVAVKTGHGGESVSKRMEFLKEASVMKQFNSYHVVRLLGVVSKSLKPMMVMEYMFNGDLKTYLRSIRPDAENRRDDTLTLQQKLQMCGEIADGMAYLSDSKYVHRDLAARNCLVHENMTVKISDFGLTRDVYETDYYRIDSRGILPVRWMAPESLKDGVFDSRSDVWSFGVVLWEIATLAEQPYQGRQHDEVTRFVIDGGYMEQPRECPQKLYDLMLMCWHYSPSMRPTFLEIVSHLMPDLSDNFKEVSFYGEQKNVIERDVEDLPYMNGSDPSTEGLLHYNGTITDKPDVPQTENNFRHMNGGRQPAPNAPEPEAEGPEKEEDQESSRYIPHPIQTHRHTTTC